MAKASSSRSRILDGQSPATIEGQNDVRNKPVQLSFCFKHLLKGRRPAVVR